MEIGTLFKRWINGRYVLYTVIEVKTSRKCVVMPDNLHGAPAISSITISQRRDGSWLPIGTVYGYDNPLFFMV